MSERRVVDRFLSKFGLARVETQRAGAAPKETPVFIDRQADEIEKRIKATLERYRSTAEDRVFVITLDKCRERFGDKWESAKEKVRETVTRIISARLLGEDIFIEREDGSFLIVFGSLNQKEAQIKCTLICDEIIRRLIGSDESADLVEVKKVVVDENGAMQMEELTPLDSILDEIAEKSVEAEAQAAGPIGDFFQQVNHADLEDVRFIFRPMLSVSNRVISTFLCFPVRPVQEQLFLSGYDVLIDEKVWPSHYLELDLLTLGKIASELERLSKRKEKSLLAVPIHFETLADLGRRTEYVNLCAEKVTEFRDQIVFELVGLPNGIPQPRLVELVAALRPYGRAVIARFPPEHRNFSGFHSAGLHAVGIDVYSTLKREETLIPEMNEFARVANKNRLKTYVHGVRSISLYTAAVAAGFDYAAGHALTSVAEMAEGAYAFKIESPYLRLQEPDGAVDVPQFQDLNDENQ